MRVQYGSVDQNNLRYHPAGYRPMLPPVQWWRTKTPIEFNKVHAREIRQALITSTVVCDGNWLMAATGDAATAIGLAIASLRRCGMMNPLADIVMSAVLCCAIEGDPTARVVIMSALRRRARFDPICRQLHSLWLTARFERP